VCLWCFVVADGMLYLALAASTAGLVLITLVSPSIEPPVSGVADIDASSLEKVVKFEGNVSRQHLFKGGSMVLSVSDGPASVDVFIPYDKASGFSRLKLVGKNVEVTGVVRLYQGRVEVVVEKQGSMVVR